MSSPVLEGTVVPTQVANPGRTSVRTIFQVLIGVIFAIPALWMVVQSAFDQQGAAIPGWLAGAGASLLAFATLATRIMAAPGVDDFLAAHGITNWLAADPVVSGTSKPAVAAAKAQSEGLPAGVVEANVPVTDDPSVDEVAQAALDDEDSDPATSTDEEAATPDPNRKLDAEPEGDF